MFGCSAILQYRSNVAAISNAWCGRRLEAWRKSEHSRNAIGRCADAIGKESVMIKLGKVSVETRGVKAIYPEEIVNVPFTQF
jgi:hypothetical protein